MGILYTPGLEGIVSAFSSLRNIGPEQDSLARRCCDFHELAKQSSFEEVAFFLLRGRLPDTQERECFRKELSRHREVPVDLINMLRPAAYRAHPLDMLRNAVVFMGNADPEARDLSREALVRKSIRTIAKLPTLIAASYRLAEGHEPISPMGLLTHAENFLYMLSGYKPDDDAVTALDRVLVLYAAHEADVSSFRTGVAASSFIDYHSAITRSIESLKTRLPGRADEHSIHMLRSISELDQAEKWLTGTLAWKQLIMGFGRRVDKNGDARARMMKDLSRELAEKLGDMRRHSLCEKIEEIMLLEKQMHHELDFYAAPVLNIIGVPVELSAVVFAAGRIAGWSAQVIVQLGNQQLTKPLFEYRKPKQSLLKARSIKTKVPNA